VKEEQHDNHIWLTVSGQAWAIRAIHKPIFYLWRGYMHDGTLETASLDTSEVDWDMYCERAAEFIENGIW